MPSTRGPIPKRSDQRRRSNVPDIPIAKVAAPVRPAVPGPVDGWHQLAAEWYEALRVSGQAQFFEASDWAQARIWADLISRALLQDKPSAVMVAAWASGAAELLTTEGARRRVRIELERVKVADPDAEEAEAMILSLAEKLGG